MPVRPGRACMPRSQLSPICGQQFVPQQLPWGMQSQALLSTTPCNSCWSKLQCCSLEGVNFGACWVPPHPSTDLRLICNRPPILPPVRFPFEWRSFEVGSQRPNLAFHGCKRGDHSLPPRQRILAWDHPCSLECPSAGRECHAGMPAPS